MDTGQIIRLNVGLSGLSQIMFDRFIDHSKEVRPPEQKLYLTKDKVVVLPSENVNAFLFSENPPGCAKAFEAKGGKEFIRLGQSHVVIQPSIIPFTSNGKKVIFKEFDDKTFSIFEAAPRTKQGSLSIKQETKFRPVLEMPWEIDFQIVLIKNEKLDGDKLKNWFDRGGIEIGLGTYRPRFGRFMVIKWEVAK